VNALLYRFGAALSRGATVLAEEDAEEAEDDSEVPQETPQPGSQAALRPGIVHRLDKQTSGLIVVAKNDSSHRRLVESFAERRVKKTYLALSHGWIAEDEGTIELAVGRDATRRTRMTTRRNGLGMRHAVSHWRVLERLDGPFGRFTLAEVRIETGRTHQIRVHLQSIGHAVVGDTLYGSPAVVKPVAKPGSPKASRRVEPADPQRGGIALERNFLHAAELELTHPRTGKALALKTELPPELERVLEQLRGTS
jgi:23S rRNA pseudouridine1911/1915/1917 synthase